MLKPLQMIKTEKNHSRMKLIGRERKKEMTKMKVKTIQRRVELVKRKGRRLFAFFKGSK